MFNILIIEGNKASLELQPVRNRPFNLEKTLSAGLYAGQYLGRRRYSAPIAATVTRATVLLHPLV